MPDENRSSDSRRYVIIPGHGRLDMYYVDPVQEGTINEKHSSCGLMISFLSLDLGRVVPSAKPNSTKPPVHTAVSNTFLPSLPSGLSRKKLLIRLSSVVPHSLCTGVLMRYS